MKLRHIILTISMISTWTLLCTASSGPDEQECEKACVKCFAVPEDSLQRLGCFEMCIAEAADQFTCPGRQTFLSEVSTPSSVLQSEVKKFYEYFGSSISAHDIERYGDLLTEDSTIVIDHQKPTFGRHDRKRVLSDYFMANPMVDYIKIVARDFGEENGVIWVNGVITYYDGQNQEITTFRFMHFLRRIGEELKDCEMVLFS